MELKEIYRELEQDFRFFREYKGDFKKTFSQKFVSLYPKTKNSPLLNTLMSRLYALMFSMRLDPRKELYDLCLALLQVKMDPKPALVEALLCMTKAYMDFLSKNMLPYRRLKLFIDLVDIYVQTAEKANVDYIRSLEKAIKKKDLESKSKDREVALEFLKTLLKEGKVRLIAYTDYKGSFADTSAYLVEVDDLGATLHTENSQAYSLGATVYLKGSYIPFPIVGIVKDKKNGIVALSVRGFKWISKEKRKHLRVVPEEEIKVKLSKDGTELVGTLADISLEGLGVYLESTEGISKGDTVKIEFKLSGKRLKLIGEIEYIKPHTNVSRVGIHFEPDVVAEDVIGKYIIKRELALLKDMKSS